MRIALFGATGRVARPILGEALARGHQLTAVTRDASRARLPSHENLRIVEGDVLFDVTDVASGLDAVISAIGAPRGSSGELLVEAAHSFVEGLNEAGVRRLLVVGGAGTLEEQPGLRHLDSPEFPVEARPTSEAHLEALKVYASSQLDWTVISPAAEFKPGERTGRYRTSEGMLIRDEEGNSKISFEDYAIATIDEVENPKFLRTHMAVGY